VEILYKINQCLQSSRPLLFVKYRGRNGNYKLRNEYRLNINNINIAKSLIKLGIMQNKTFILKMPKLNRDSFIKSFILGYFDGDGCLTWSFPRKTIRSQIVIVGTSNICLYFKKFITEKLNINCIIDKRFKDNKNNFNLRICGNRQVKIFLTFLYSREKIFLQRKREKFAEFIRLYE